tara:strand:+ start:187 stop:321 length:135 start_codon:yes stop_codon:yes gene_type:complete
MDFNKDPETRYLEQATDHVDLENRIRTLDRGEASFQKYTNRWWE